MSPQLVHTLFIFNFRCEQSVNEAIDIPGMPVRGPLCSGDSSVEVDPARKQNQTPGSDDPLRIRPPRRPDHESFDPLRIGPPRRPVGDRDLDPL